MTRGARAKIRAKDGTEHQSQQYCGQPEMQTVNSTMQNQTVVCIEVRMSSRLLELRAAWLVSRRVWNTTWTADRATMAVPRQSNATIVTGVCEVASAGSFW